MKKSDLLNRVAEYKVTIHDALQLIWDSTNKGQRNKMLKNPEIKALLERYEIITEE